MRCTEHPSTARAPGGSRGGVPVGSGRREREVRAARRARALRLQGAAMRAEGDATARRRWAQGRAAGAACRVLRPPTPGLLPLPPYSLDNVSSLLLLPDARAASTGAAGPTSRNLQQPAALSPAAASSWSTARDAWGTPLGGGGRMGVGSGAGKSRLQPPAAGQHCGLPRVRGAGSPLGVSRPLLACLEALLAVCGGCRQLCNFPQHAAGIHVAARRKGWVTAAKQGQPRPAAWQRPAAGTTPSTARSACD